MTVATETSSREYKYKDVTPLKTWKVTYLEFGVKKQAVIVCRCLHDGIEMLIGKEEGAWSRVMVVDYEEVVSEGVVLVSVAGEEMN